MRTLVKILFKNNKVSFHRIIDNANDPEIYKHIGIYAILLKI